MTPDARSFHNQHPGETCLIVCNGPSLYDVPPELLQHYPTVACNSIVEWRDFVPTYYVTVDDRVRREYGDLIKERYANVPKFIPHPNLESWTGKRFYWWLHRPGELWPHRERIQIDPTFLTDPGITWYCCPHASMQIALFMGFTTLLIVGMDHSKNRKQHAWGEDTEMPGPTDSEGWWVHLERGHKALVDAFALQGVRMLNISPGTFEKAIPKDDWRNWI